MRVRGVTTEDGVGLDQRSRVLHRLSCVLILAAVLSGVTGVSAGATQVGAEDRAGELSLQIVEPLPDFSVAAGAEMCLKAAMSWKGRPLAGRPFWHATAILRGPIGERWVRLYDDGRGRDASASDGIWSASLYAPEAAGDYSIHVDCTVWGRRALSPPVTFRAVTSEAREPAAVAAASPAASLPTIQPSWPWSWLALWVLVGSALAGVGSVALARAVGLPLDRAKARAEQKPSARGDTGDAATAIGALPRVGVFKKINEVVESLQFLHQTARDGRQEIDRAYREAILLGDRYADLKAQTETALKYADRLEDSAESMRAVRRRLRQVVEDEAKKGT